MKMNGARILVEELIHQGVEVIFGYPGGAVLNIYDELYLASDRIRHVLSAHEQGAAHAADGYALSLIHILRRLCWCWDWDVKI